MGRQCARFESLNVSLEQGYGELMKIGINAQLLSFRGNYRQAGVSKYIQALIEQFAAIDQRNSYRLFVPPAPRPVGFAAAPNFRFHQSKLPTERPPVRILWEQLALPAQSGGLDVLHCPVNIRPLLAACPTVVTIHDLIYLIYADKHKAAKRGYLSLLTGWSVRHASHVIAVSESTKRDIVRLLHVPAAKITVIHNGVDERYRPLPANEVAAFRKRHGLPACYVLYVGTLEPRKNVPTLLKAFAAICNGDGLGDVKLVIGGAKGWLVDDLQQQLASYGLSGDRVLFPGYLDNEELPLWYNGASLFVYPSLYEGFGLPPAEAMACGVPTIVANSSSLPEVVGDAGLLVAPDDVAALGDAMAAILSSPLLAARLGEAGRERSRRFSWRRTAEQTLAVYEAAARK